MNKTTCPYCGNPDCEAEFVDIGVGEQQVTPYTCNQCGAYQLAFADEWEAATDKEKQTGWKQ